MNARPRIRLRTLAAAAALAISAAPAAQAGLFRAYLASDGSDANPCTVVAPCRLLPAALAAVNDGGSIWMLDSANYNTAPVGITKSVTILAIPGAVGSVVGSGGNAIEVATAGVSVTLRNLNIIDFNAGVSGVVMTGGTRLRIEDSVIYGFAAGAGIVVATEARAIITDTIVRDNFTGIFLDNGAIATVSRVHLLGNAGTGLFAIAQTAAEVRAFVSDTVASGNGAGIVAQGGAGFTRVAVTRSAANGNQSTGFATYSGGGAGNATLDLSGSVAAGNGSYGLYNGGATFTSAGNNRSSGSGFLDVSGTITPAASQ